VSYFALRRGSNRLRIKLLPTIATGVSSLLKRGLTGTCISVEPFHLFRYMDEQAFRFNSRKVSDGTRFARQRDWTAPHVQAFDRQGLAATAALIRPRQGWGGRGKLRSVEHHEKPYKPDLSPFDRFREFARRIIAVPKSEIDREGAEYQRQKLQRRKTIPRKGDR
jgi:hypothetical protein